jgi:hypothetical protein
MPFLSYAGPPLNFTFSTLIRCFAGSAYSLTSFLRIYTGLKRTKIC